MELSAGNGGSVPGLAKKPVCDLEHLELALTARGARASPPPKLLSLKTACTTTTISQLTITTRSNEASPLVLASSTAALYTIRPIPAPRSTTSKHSSPQPTTATGPCPKPPPPPTTTTTTTKTTMTNPSPPSPPARETSFASLTTIASALSWGLSHLTSSSRVASPTITPSSSRPRTPIYSPPPLAPLKLTGYAPTTTNRLLTRSLGEEIRSLLPARLQLFDTWTLAYSLEQHGVSLSTLYAKTAVKPRSGYVLVVKDTDGRLFGAFVSEGFRPSGGRYYGTGECFLWTTEIAGSCDSSDSNDSGNSGDGGGDGVATAGEEEKVRKFRAFPYSGENDYVILCEHGFLSMGGGDGRFGLWLDDRFEKGVSQRSVTFGNDPLSEASGGKFEVLDVELWRVGL
ncbi:TLD-domain-containing protein [Ascodesmis nigricans]|uniref:Oxidation resistance protein 1 n=1 Tax=Ascodesmis nigricans TaxID=341454 RepID=A0A4S2MZP5_9PEZI|nr:TLD-domain-containing protein [Ascodesmis nigricans]